MVALARTVFATAVAVAVQCVRAQDGVSVRIMSFNVRTSQASGDAGSTCSNWHGVRKTNVIKEITTVMPDFFGTQETADEQKGYMDSQLAGTYTAVGKATGSLNGMASEIDALYYKTADWKVLSDGTFWFGPNTDAPSAAWGMKYYRTAVWGRFQHIQSGETACVFNTHYETPGNDEAQIQASTILLQKLDALCLPTDKIKVVTGDFNALPNYPAMIKLFQNDLTESSTDPTFCGDMMSSNCQTKFDYTLHRLKDGACWTKSEVLRTAFDGCYPSDHAALLGTFCFGGSCCGGPTTLSPSNQTATNSTGAGSSSGGVGAVLGSVAPPLASGESDAGSTAGSATTQITTKNAEGGSSATGTVVAIIGVIAATAGVAFVVVRKKRALDAKMTGAKHDNVPVPSFFARGADSEHDSDALSPRASAPPSPGRMSNSPVPTLCATQRVDSRNSRSSSVSCTDLSPSKYARKTSGASSGFRISSPAMMGDDDGSSNYSSSASYDARMKESCLNFSEASYDYDGDSGDSGALTKSSRTDFAML